jgi:hypothetical protein
MAMWDREIPGKVPKRCCNATALRALWHCDAKYHAFVLDIQLKTSIA